MLKKHLLTVGLAVLLATTSSVPIFAETTSTTSTTTTMENCGAYLFEWRPIDCGNGNYFAILVGGNTLQESRLKTHHLIRSWLQPKLGAVGTRYRLAGRIRLANIWARKHPRRTFAYVTGSLFFLLASTVAIDSMTLSDKREPDVSSIAQLEPVFAGFRTIQANKSIHRTTLTELTHEGQLLREELDSLIAIPCKSHQDSIHIVQSYNRLESIVKSLQNNDHP